MTKEYNGFNYFCFFFNLHKDDIFIDSTCSMTYTFLQDIVLGY